MSNNYSWSILDSKFLFTFYLWSTDAAPEVPHPRPTRRDAATLEGCRCLRVRPCHATWFFCFLADSRRQGSDSGCIGRFRPKLKKKKKRCETHRLSQILNPTFSSFHTNTQNKFSASLSLCHSSLTLSVLSASVSACCETLSQCWVSHLTHFSSFLLQLSPSLSRILNSSSFQS